MTIVILGAGELGATFARQVAAADILSRVVLVDESGTVAAGKALDIAQSGPVDRFSTALAGTDDESAVVGAGIIAIADKASGSVEWEGEAGLALVRRASRLNQLAPILCVGPTASELIERGVSELGLPFEQSLSICGVFVLWLALRFGVYIAVLGNLWLELTMMLLPAVPIAGMLPTAGLQNLQLALAVLVLAGLVTGRVISDVRTEIAPILGPGESATVTLPVKESPSYRVLVPVAGKAVWTDTAA